VSSAPHVDTDGTGSWRALKAMAGGLPVFVSAAVDGSHELRLPGLVTCVSSNDAATKVSDSPSILVAFVVRQRVTSGM